MLVFEVSVAVTVCGPGVEKYQANCAMPLTMVALVEPFSTCPPLSVEVRVIVSVTPPTELKWESTAKTVTVAPPCVPDCRSTGVGVPVIPVAVLGALVSPGNKMRSWLKLRWIRVKNSELVPVKSLLEINC